ncbi:MAG: thermonuclease family protein [Pseudomonadota bacterium]
MICSNRISSFFAAATFLMMVWGPTGCAPEATSTGDAAQSIRWSDGDSGESDGVRFRLVDVDAPETGPVGSERGARCSSEQALGHEAKTFMDRLTRNAALTVRTYETDRYGRIIIGLDADGENVIDQATEAGFLQA